MGETMMIIAALDVVIIGIGGAILSYVLKIESRLTRVEVIIENK